MSARESMALKSVFVLMARIFPYYIRPFGVAEGCHLAAGLT